MVHLISYDLNGHERPRAYTQVKNVIEANAISWRKPLYTQWLVETNFSANQWADLLKPVMDGNDRLLVSRMRSGDYQGWLDQQSGTG